jgi:hypothetical protein
MKTGMKPVFDFVRAIRYFFVAYRGMRKDRAEYLKGFR